VTMPAFADTRVITRPLLIAAGLLVAAVLLLTPAVGPEPAFAQTGCSPNGDDTFTPGGDPGDPPPGGVVVGPGEDCPETDPVAEPPPEELPPPPKCDPCKDPKDNSDTESSSASAATPVPTQRLPFTGINEQKTVFTLCGFGLLALGLGLGLRRRTFRS
jgi:hypothetical protein